MSTQEAILRDIRIERQAQDDKWGSQRDLSPMEWLTILVEEVGEVAEAILKEQTDNYPVELIQVAAVAVAALESREMQRRGRE